MGRGGKGTDLEALVELSKDIIAFRLAGSHRHFMIFRMRIRNQTYDALYDALEEDSLSLVVRIFHRIV